MLIANMGVIGNAELFSLNGISRGFRARQTAFM